MELIFCASITYTFVIRSSLDNFIPRTPSALFFFFGISAYGNFKNTPSFVCKTTLSSDSSLQSATITATSSSSDSFVACTVLFDAFNKSPSITFNMLFAVANSNVLCIIVWASSTCIIYSFALS